MIAFICGAVQFHSQVQNFISSMTVDIFLDLIIRFTHYKINSKNKAVIFSLWAQKTTRAQLYIADNANQWINPYPANK